MPDITTLLDGPPPNALVRLIVDLVCALGLMRGIYYRRYRHDDLFLTFFSFNVSIFLITFLLNRVDITMGAAFGLFAVFSMLRYRTENLSARDMTYLFLLIALGLITAVAQVSWSALVLIGAMMLVVTLILESNILARRANTQRVEYENLMLVTPQRRADLMADLRVRTGLDVYRVEVDSIDLVRESARLTVYFYEGP